MVNLRDNRTSLGRGVGMAVFAVALAGAWLLWRDSPGGGGRPGASPAASLREAAALEARGGRESLREASGKYDEASRGLAAAGDLHRALDCLRRAAEIDRRLGDLESAQLRSQRARELADGLGEARLLIQAFNDSAFLAIARGELPEGERLAELALRRAVSLGRRREEARALENLGEVDYSKGDLRGSIRNFARAFGIWSELDDSEGRARTLMSLGFCRSDLGEMGEGLRLFEESMDISRAVGDARREAIALASIGRLKSRVGNWQEAIDHFLRARRILQPIGDLEWEASIWNGLGFVYENLGRPKMAVEHFAQAVKGFEESGLQNALADNLHDAGRAALKAGDAASALAYFERSLEMSRRMGDRRLESYVLGDLGIVREESGETAEALRLYREALAIHREEGDLRRQAFVLTRIGLLGESSGAAADAPALYREALDLAEQAMDRRMEAMTRHNLARMERRAGRPLQALRQIEASIKLMENLRADVSELDLRATFWASAQESLRFLVDLLMELDEARPGRGYQAGAFEASERLRARSLLDLLRAAGAKERGSADNSRSQDGDRPVRPSLPALAEARPLSLGEIQERTLGPGTVLLEYLLGEERSLVWVVSSNAARVVALPPRRELESLARTYYELLSEPEKLAERLSGTGSSGEMERCAAALSRVLLGPVAEDLRGRRLLLVTEGALQYVSFAALPDPAALDSPDPAPLAVGHEIVSLPSASALAVLRREFGSRPAAPKTVAVFADPVFSPDDLRVDRAAEQTAAASDDTPPENLWTALRADGHESLSLERLPNSRREAQEIVTLADPGSALSALAFRATREAALTLRLRDYRILHFATHGIIDSQHPERSAIVLSMVDEAGRPLDGRLRLNDVYNLELSADLVVLSACRTALGQDVRGEGLIGLTRGFMHAGAKRVLASLWRVEDRAGAELMARFYRGVLRQNLTPAAALRQAQISMLQGDRPTWRDPFFWAGFVLQGEWN